MMAQIFDFNGLPDIVKDLIVDHMDIVSRCRFKQCSRDSHSLVESRPVRFSHVICDAEYVDSRPFGLLCTLRLDGFKIERRCRSRTVSGEKQEVYSIPPEMKRILNKQVLNANVQIDYLKMTWDLPAQFLQYGQFINVKSIELSCTRAEQQKIWLDHIVPGVESIVLDQTEMNHFDLLEYIKYDIASHPLLINAKSLKFKKRFPLDDVHLETYKATEVCYQFESDDAELFDEEEYPQVTVPGIVRLLKRWIAEDYPIGAKFELHCHGNGMKDIQFVIPFVHELFYSMRRRTYDNQIEIKVNMNAEKYIEVKPVQDGDYWYIRAIVRSSAVAKEENRPSWNSLPLEIKAMIVEKMDIFTRNRLKVCSKSDKALVESIRFHYTKLELYDSDYFFQIDDFLAISCENSKLCVYGENPNKQYDDKLTLRRRIMYNSDEEAFDVWRSILEIFANNKKVKIDTCEMFNCERDVFGSNGLGALATIMNTNHIVVVFCEVTNDEILALKATQIVINTCSRESIRLLIQKWIQEDYPVGSYFHLSIDIDNRKSVFSMQDYEDIYDGLNYEQMDERLFTGEYKKVLIQMGEHKCMKLVIEKGPDNSDRPASFHLKAVGIIM